MGLGFKNRFIINVVNDLLTPFIPDIFSNDYERSENFKFPIFEIRVNINWEGLSRIYG